jgi:hypothetical protein
MFPKNKPVGVKPAGSLSVLGGGRRVGRFCLGRLFFGESSRGVVLRQPGEFFFFSSGFDGVHEGFREPFRRVESRDAAVFDEREEDRGRGTGVRVPDEEPVFRPDLQRADRRFDEVVVDARSGVVEARPQRRLELRRVAQRGDESGLAQARFRKVRVRPGEEVFQDGF